MTGRRLLACLLATAVATGPASRAAADGADGAEAFVGGLLGSAIGSAISNSVQQRQQPRVVVRDRTVYRQPRAPVVSTAQREDNRRVQTALNYFDFPAGVPDGVMGRNSRAAVATYQSFMGLPATGVLADYDRAFLLTSYDRAIIGGTQTAQIMAQGGQGPRGLLIAFRQEQMGLPAAAPVVAAVPVPVAPVAPPPAAMALAPETAPVAPAAAELPTAIPAKASAALTGLPSFMPETKAASIAAHCNRVGIETNANQGPIAVMDAMVEGFDADQALSEQFCLARSYAIDQGQSLIATVQGFTAEEMQEQCEAFGPTMRPYIMQLAAATPAEVEADLRRFLDSTGAQPTQMSGTSRICLGIGYGTDNAELALGSALVLVALGEQPYGELVGYQLAEGFGMPARPDRGYEWMNIAVNALQGGATPLVPDPDDARAGVLAMALVSLAGPGQPDAVMQAKSKAGDTPAAAFALPQAPASN